ncbi:MAG: methionyl-tRNA formyltransferase [bacterium]
MKRVVFFGNNWLGYKVLEELVKSDVEVVGVVLHPTEEADFEEKILQQVESIGSAVIRGRELGKKNLKRSIQDLDPDIGVSAMYGYILPGSLIDVFPEGIVNLHPAYLPYNRGAFPNVWSIIDQTPAGVSLHYMDAGIDTGDIIAREEVDVEPVDTGKTLYEKLENHALELFRDTWPSIIRGKVESESQDPEEGTYHEKDDVEEIDRIMLDQTYRARELINRIRARTFPPYKGAYFIENGDKVFVRMQLYYENELPPGGD